MKSGKKLNVSKKLLFKKEQKILDEAIIKNIITKLKLISFIISNKAPSSSIKIRKHIRYIETELEKLI
ncbi:MAG: hypothetical protein N2Z20_00705 [Elusimicrobiales bacterium]|nr:hypothetical protein [Elusimicrobiales bacterium]